MIENVKQKAKQILKDYLNEKGAILYSSIETLKGGNVYILGLNPAGVENKENLNEIIDNLHERKENAYLDENWSSKTRTYKIGMHPIQKGLKSIANSLKENIEDICASNIIFIATKRSNELNFWKLASMCWPLHEEILKIVQPKVVIVFGIDENGSAYSFLKNKFKPKKIISYASHHGAWECYSFKTDNYTIIAVPHLSCYSVYKYPDVLEWINHRYMEAVA
ncbi:MAG: hypothetical protein KAT48_01435 [Bacteroidales bacterium]|nr:hypothetical protein [Bacteroidales bacterium]